jgi:hypothetical protein
MLAFKNNSLSLETYLVLRCALFTYLAHMSSKQYVGHLITKTIIEMAQGHISLSPTLILHHSRSISTSPHDLHLSRRLSSVCSTPAHHKPTDMVAHAQSHTLVSPLP